MFEGKILSKVLLYVKGHYVMAFFVYSFELVLLSDSMRDFRTGIIDCMSSASPVDPP